MFIKSLSFIFLLASCLHAFEYLEQPPKEWKSAYVMANGIRIHYWRTGGDKPVMIMAHGSSDYGLCWTNLAKELSSDYDIILADARGHGFSDPPQENTLKDAQVEDIAALIKALNLHKPIVMGHSMGSAAAAWFAAKYPNVPKAIILEDPRLEFKSTRPQPSNIAPDQAEKTLKKMNDILMKNNQNPKDLAAKCLEQNPLWGKSECDIWAPSKLLHHPNNAYRTIGDQPSMGELFEKITVPTLILKADAQGELREKNIEVAKILKNGTLVHIAGAKHNVRRDQKELLLKELKAFLAKLN